MHGHPGWASTLCLCLKSLSIFTVCTQFALGSSPLPSRKAWLLPCHCYAMYLKHSTIHSPTSLNQGLGDLFSFRGFLLCTLLYFDFLKIISWPHFSHYLLPHMYCIFLQQNCPIFYVYPLQFLLMPHSIFVPILLHQNFPYSCHWWPLIFLNLIIEFQSLQ